MMMFKVTLICALLGCVFGRQYKIVAESEIDIQGMKDRVSYFDKSWRDIFNEKQLHRQPKWKIVENDTEHKSYEVRQYDEAWFVSSHTPCLNQSESAADGYVRLYIFMDINNVKHPNQYPLTYPILSKVELGAEAIDRHIKTSGDNVRVSETDKEQVSANKPVEYVVGNERIRYTPQHKTPIVDGKAKDLKSICPDRFSQQFYLPIPVTQTPPKPSDVSISTDLVPKRTYFVRRYADEFTHESQRNCNLQAGLLARTLALSGVRFNPRSYYCAMYEPGTSDVTAHFEVWFEAVNEM
ncbi:uncharacterized protein LOC120346659 [Styela clava]